MSIFTLTVNPALDKSTTVPELVPNDKLRCTPPTYNPGGGGINVARVIKRLGGGPTAIFQTSGIAGKMIEEFMEEEQISCIPYATKAWTRENLMLWDEAAQKQYRICMPGPTYLPEEVEGVYDLLKQLNPLPEFLVLSGSLAPGMPENFFEKVCAWANKEGIKVVLDTSGAPLKKGVEAGVHLIKPNLKELCGIVGKPAVSDKEQEQFALSLIDRKKAKLVVVSLGSEGAMMASEEGIEYLKSPDVQTKSTVGAGDSMVGGMVWALACGFNNRDVLRYGVACGSAAAMTEGTELCKKEDVMKLLGEI